MSNATHFKGKQILIVILLLYSLSFIVAFILCLRPDRYPVLENRTEHGVVYFKNEKYPTTYQLHLAQIRYRVEGPLEYLMLSSRQERSNILSVALELALTVVAIIFIWRLNLQNPYTDSQLKLVSLACKLVAAVALCNLCSELYTEQWAETRLMNTGFSYKNHNAWWETFLTIIVSGVILSVYKRAVRDKEEADLTI